MKVKVTPTGTCWVRGCKAPAYRRRCDRHYGVCILCKAKIEPERGRNALYCSTCVVIVRRTSARKAYKPAAKEPCVRKPPVRLSTPRQLDLTATSGCPSGYVYRLWDAAGGCLYVGLTRRSDPLERVLEHQAETWWSDVVRADYVAVLEGSVSVAEGQQAAKLKPRHNLYLVEQTL